MENLLIYSFCELDNRKYPGINSQGILGIGNAKRNLLEGRDIWHKPDVNSEVLVRQISLGINGRYKGPFIQMGIFDSEYNTYSSHENWDKINDLFRTWKPASNLCKELIAILKDGIFKNLKARTDKIPALTNQVAITDKLVKLYASCFGNHSSVPDYIYSFWLDILDFNSGSAGAIYKSVDKYKESENFNHMIVLTDAIELKNIPGFDSDEKSKINNILILEPFLSIISALFNYAATITIKDLHDVEIFYSKIKDYNTSQLHLLPEKPERLDELIKIFEGNSNNLSDLLTNILEYHKRIMDERKLIQWFEIDERGRIIHTGRSNPVNMKESLDDISLDNLNWINPYYLDSVRSIALGMGASL